MSFCATRSLVGHSSVYDPTLHTFPHQICRVELCTELFPYLVSTLFADLLSLHLVTFLMFFILVHVTFFSSRCMLELKFVIYYRAASLPSQASDAVLAEESQAFFKHSPHTNSISIQQSCVIITFRCYVICAHAYT